MNLQADLCVIGAGSGGLSVAAVASQMGLNVVLVERDKMGGDCLNYGCVPSKALLAAAKHADKLHHLEKFGIGKHEPKVDYAKVRDHVHAVIESIAPHDSVERFVSLGVKVVQGTAVFVRPGALMVDEMEIQAKRFVIATGSRAAIPPIPGLDKTPYLTNETIFDLDVAPKRLIVIGGGPIGCEMAQAYLMLGTPVTVLEAFSILPKDDPELVEVVRKRLLTQGLDLFEHAKVLKTEASADGVVVTIDDGKGERRIEGSHLLVATGRKPNIDLLDLNKVGVEYTPHGIKVDARLRTSNKRIYAIGDAAGSFQFTHAANYHAGIVIRNIIFHLPAKVNYKAMPWVTYTSPELAHVGLTEAMVKERGLNCRVVTFPIGEIDRFVAELEGEGLIKVVADKKGRILGASIVAAEAGELILPWVMAIQNKLKLSAVAGLIVPYPTRGDITKRVAGEFFTPTLYSDKVRKIVRFLAKF